MYGRTTKEHVCCTVWGDTTIRYILIKNPKVSVRNVVGRGFKIYVYDQCVGDKMINGKLKFSDLCIRLLRCLIFLEH